MANGHGGKRNGAGRKTKAEILGLAELIDESWPLDEQKKVLAKLANDCISADFHTRHEARKLLLAYKFGKPKETHDLNVLGRLEVSDLIKPKL